MNTLPPLTIKDIINVVNGKLLQGDPNLSISRFFYDSRKIYDSKNSMFIALIDKRDGHLFIGDAVRKGVDALLVSRNVECPNDKVSVILVEDTLRALCILARYWRSLLKGKIVAILGTYGKTTLKELLALILNKCEISHSVSLLSYNSLLGVSLSILSIKSDAPFHIFEVAQIKPNDLKKVKDILKPDIVLITDISQTFLGHFASLDEKLQDLFEFCEGVETLLFPASNPILAKNLTKHGSKIFSWSWESNFYVKPSIQGSLSLDKVYIMHTQSGSQFIIEDTQISQKLFIIYGFIRALALLDAIGGLPFIKKAISIYEELPDILPKTQIFQGVNNSVIINDSYSFQVESLEELLSNAQIFNKRKSMLILSDIPSVYYAPNVYQKIANIVEQSQVSQFIGIGQNIRELSPFLKKGGAIFFSSIDDFLKSFSKENLTDKAVILKGHHHSGFDRLAKEFALSPNQTILEVNLQNIVDNYKYFKKICGNDIEVMCVLKASAYGSGISEIALKLQEAGAGYFIVTLVDEGIALRKAGIYSKILILNPYQVLPEVWQEYSFDIALNSLNQAYSLLKVDPLLNSCISLHLKIDTGFHRYGISPSEINELIQIAKKFSNFKISYCFTHLAAPANPYFHDYTKKQIELFNSVLSYLKREYSNDIKTHIYSSGGLNWLSFYKSNGIRVGIGLHGFSPDPTHQPFLKNPYTLKAPVIQVKKINKGDAVGYDLSYIAPSTRKIAIIAIGYADGIPLWASKKNVSFFYNSKPLPLIGRTCMDVCFVDASKTDIKEGDFVEIFGDNSQPFYSLAHKLEKSPYELLTSLSSRIKRVYVVR